MRMTVLLFSVSCLLLLSCSRSDSSNPPKPGTTETTPAANSPAPAPSPVQPQPATPVAVRPQPKRDAAKAVVVTPPPPVAPTSAPAAESRPVRPAPVEAAPAPPLAPPPPAGPIRVVDTRNMTIPAGTEISVRMIDSVDSKTAHENDTFHGSIDSPVIIDNLTVLPKGADVYLKVIHVSTAGEVKGRSNLQVALDRILLGRNSYTVQSNVYETSGAPQGEKTVRNGAIGAAIGAAVGAIAGGGKGAVIGAGAGAGGGVGTAVLTKDDVRIESESRLVFTLTSPIDVAALPPGSVPNSDIGPARLEPPPEPLPRERFPRRRRN